MPKRIHKTDPEEFRTFIENEDLIKIHQAINRDRSLVQRCDSYGNYPIHYVCRKNVSLDVAQMICDAGANINSKNSLGERPIQVACDVASGNLEVALELMYRGAVMTQTDLDSDILVDVFFKTSYMKERKPFSFVENEDYDAKYGEYNSDGEDSRDAETKNIRSSTESGSGKDSEVKTVDMDSEEEETSEEESEEEDFHAADDKQDSIIGRLENNYTRQDKHQGISYGQSGDHKLLHGVMDAEKCDDFEYKIRCKRSEKWLKLQDWEQSKVAYRSRLLRVGDFVQITVEKGGIDMGLVTEKRRIKNEVNKANESKQHSYRGAAYGREISIGLAVSQYIIRQSNNEEWGRLWEQENEEDRLLVEFREAFLAGNLPFKVVDVEYQFDRRKLQIYYEAQGVTNLSGEAMDEIVLKKRELMSHFMQKLHTRIYMVRIDAEGDILSRRTRVRCFSKLGLVTGKDKAGGKGKDFKGAEEMKHYSDDKNYTLVRKMSLLNSNPTQEA